MRTGLDLHAEQHLARHCAEYTADHHYILQEDKQVLERMCAVGQVQHASDATSALMQLR